MSSRVKYHWRVVPALDGTLKLFRSTKEKLDGMIFGRKKRKAGRIFPVAPINGMPGFNFDEKTFVAANNQDQMVIELKADEWSYEGKTV